MVRERDRKRPDSADAAGEQGDGQLGVPVLEKVLDVALGKIDHAVAQLWQGRRRRCLP